MPRTQRPIRPIEVDYVCDECGEGHYRPDGTMTTAYPPKFPHACTNCGHRQVFTEKYPTVRYALEGEMLNLENYAQETF